jgi:TorA maturation chaperone TorD
MYCQEVGRSELSQARAKVYQLLSTLYFKPHQPDLLRFLAEWVAPQIEAEDAYQTLSLEIRQGLSLLDSFFKTVQGKTWEEIGDAISVEFTMLFRGVKKEYSPPPPYESVYCEESGRVFGELTMEVYRQYRSFGYNLTDELKSEPPDHVSFELYFMHLMCSKEAEAWQGEDAHKVLHLQKVEREFCQKHLLTWIHRLRDRIREFDSLGFFLGLAELTVGWVAFDYQQHLQDEPLSSTAAVTED